MSRRCLKYKQEKSIPGVGLSDLIDIYRELGPEGLYQAAGVAGFEEKKPIESATLEKKEIQAPDLSVSVSSSTGMTSTPLFDNRKAPVLFWRVTRKEKKKRTGTLGRVPGWYRNAGILTPDRTRIKKEDFFLPPFEPLIRWERLWPFLKQVLGRQLDTGALDIPKVVDAAAQLKPLNQIPFEKRNGWAGSCLVIFDYSPEMVPFRKDIHILHQGIKKLRGKTGYHGVIVEDSPLCNVRMIGGKIQKRNFPAPLPGTPVLILSGLGLFSDEEHIQKAWKILGRRFKGLGIRPVVLTPASPELWDEDHGKYFSMVFWDKMTRLTGNHYTAGRLSLRQARQQAEDKAKRLVSLMAPCLGVSAGLMRRICCLMPEQDFNACVQALAWNCKEYVSADAMSCLVRADAFSAIRETFGDLDSDLKQQVFDLIKAAHAGECPSVRFAENYIWEKLLGWSDTDTRDFFSDIVKSLDHPDAAGQDSIRAYLNGLVNRMLKWKIQDQDGQVFAAWIKLHRKALETEQIELPDKLDMASFEWLLEKNKMQILDLAQQGEDLVITLPDQGRQSLQGFNSKPSPLSRMRNRMGQVRVVFGHKGKSISLPLDFKADRAASLSLKGQQRLILESDYDLIHMEAMEKPDWAVGMGRDRIGLFALTGKKTAYRKAYYIPPGSHLDSALLSGSLATENFYSIAFPSGRFWDARDLQSIQGFATPEWARASGFDDLGFWADFSYKGLVQRMRWLPPAEFLMGSPEREEDREEDEIQHLVVLTRGFWLADTACTQELWQAVTGDNPSRFKENTHPVDTVSWEDCRVFLDQINNACPGLELDFPTEAQWELACRDPREVETSEYMPFSFGKTITPDQVNYNGQYPYADAPTGEYREKTVPVKSFAPNGRGLYQMHGNLLEWCRDWYADYGNGPVVNPTGPDESDYRVLRGGAWILNARFARSASRYRFEPGDRFVNIGFRFSRGQTGTGRRPGQEIRQEKKKKEK